MTPSILPPLPSSWSELTWQQMIDCWNAKLRYGGNGDVAQAAALLALCRLTVTGKQDYDRVTGEDIYRLCGDDGRQWTVTARELAAYARQSIPWFAYPYGDPGEPAVKDDKGKVVKAASEREQSQTGLSSAEREQARGESRKEPRDPVRGYVNEHYRDALSIPIEHLTVKGRFGLRKHFALPQVMCINITWEQYRSLQGTVSNMFTEGQSDDAVLDLHAQFLAHCLVPRSIALFDTSGNSIRFRPHWDYCYNASQAEGLIKFWKETLQRWEDGPALFQVCFQAYQTAIHYYSEVFPLLFNGDGPSDPLQDAITGETGTLNAIMKYQGYNSPQEVYDTNLPIILSTLNTMTKEAKDIEQMNARIKSKR